jgi:hypothetical protein
LEPVIRWNERYKGWGNLCDNIALAFFIASGVQTYDIKGVDTSAALGVVLGLVFVWIGWHIRGLIQSEQ